MKKVKYDYVIVGAGLTGCVCARELTDKGYTCLVIDKNDYVGGLCSTKKIDEITVNRFGVHIFHTDTHRIYSYVSRYSCVRPYKYQVIARYYDKYFPFPVNLMTLNILFGITTPNKARAFIHSHKDTLMSIFFKDYSEKQWGVPFEDIPKSVLSRIPFRSDFNTNYFKNAIYEGLIDFNVFFTNLLDGIDVSLNTTFEEKLYGGSTIIYTGRIDEYSDFQFGKLGYRCVKYTEKKIHNTQQGNYVINHISDDVSYTRTIEYKYITERGFDYDIFQTEYSSADGIAAYPFRSDGNLELYRKYKNLAYRNENVHFLGRLATYQYLNMDEAITHALNYCDYTPNKQV